MVVLSNLMPSSVEPGKSCAHWLPQLPTSLCIQQNQVCIYLHQVMSGLAGRKSPIVYMRVSVKLSPITVSFTCQFGQNVRVIQIWRKASNFLSGSYILHRWITTIYGSHLLQQLFSLLWGLERVYIHAPIRKHAPQEAWGHWGDHLKVAGTSRSSLLPP